MRTLKKIEGTKWWYRIHCGHQDIVDVHIRYTILGKYVDRGPISGSGRMALGTAVARLAEHLRFNSPCADQVQMVFCPTWAGDVICYTKVFTLDWNLALSGSKLAENLELHEWIEAALHKFLVSADLTVDSHYFQRVREQQGEA